MSLVFLFFPCYLYRLFDWMRNLISLYKKVKSLQKGKKRAMQIYDTEGGYGKENSFWRMMSFLSLIFFYAK